MTSEAPQKGNPHKLTTKQHAFPRASIERFSGDKGLVELFSKKLGRVINVKASNGIFCAKRVWDQKTEIGISKPVEDKFQALVDGILLGCVSVIGVSEKTIVEEFFSLWRTRHKFKTEGLEDMRLNGVSGDSLSIDEQEILEKKHIIFMRSQGVMPGRFAAGMHVFGYLDYFRQSVKNIQWGIVRAAEGEFIVSDSFEDMMIVPITPKIALMADQPNSIISSDEVAVANRAAIERATDVYFARRLGCCPLVSTSFPRLQRVFAPDTTFH